MAFWVLTATHAHKKTVDFYFDDRDEFDKAAKEARQAGVYVDSRLDYITDASEFSRWLKETQ